jgi:hypothetical protein
MAINYDQLQFISKDKIDKVLGTFDPVTTTFAGTWGGSLTTGSSSIANPSGLKALGTMKWSVDGINFYPPRLKFAIPGAPNATVGMVVSASTVTFYWSNNTGGAVTFTVKWVLDFIDQDT